MCPWTLTSYTVEKQDRMQERADYLEESSADGEHVYDF